MTFSIVARDPETGALGVATATGGPVVGSLVPHARAGAGAIATQSNTNPLYGYDGLDLLAAAGSTAESVLERLLAGDPGRDARQCIILDREGRTATWTGPACTPEAGAIGIENVAVAGNILADRQVLTAMLDAVVGCEGRLEDRLLTGLAAGLRAGGDRRGVRSAALKVYTSEPYPAVDLRADWSATPVTDLGEILRAVREPDYAGFFERVPTRAG